MSQDRSPTQTTEPMHFSVTTLGCRANQADSARLRAILLDAGFEERPFGEQVDCSIVNTCTVTREADRKSRQLIRRALKAVGSEGKVVATGCAVAARGGLKTLPGSALRLPPDRKEDILTLLGAQGCPGREPLPSVQNRARALLKIQDGCDQFCTFCIVPYVRGRSRSVPTAQVVEEAARLESLGYQEVVLTGIHLAIWGHDLDGEPNLADLVRAILLGTPGIRIRLASVEPDRFPLELLDVMAQNPRLCPYLHLVLQHASDRVLSRMHRGYDLATYQRIVRDFFQKVPSAALSSDIMVGFPGETDQDFQLLVNTLKETPFYHLHVFPYSLRPGTSASKFPDQVSPEVKKTRRDTVLKMAEKLKIAAMRRTFNSVSPVLFESASTDSGWIKGTTHNGMSLIARGGETLINRIVPVTIVSRRGQDLVGRVL